MQSKKEIEKVYWEGYIQKQNEAMEICKKCKYIKKVRELETREQKLKEKLQELEKEYRKALEENSIEAFILKCQIEILKELLEEK